MKPVRTCRIPFSLHCTLASFHYVSNTDYNNGSDDDDGDENDREKTTAVKPIRTCRMHLNRYIGKSLVPVLC